ncbi:MAG: dienelactone hydrolase family protein, partial [Chloroflexota bacterium]
MSGQDRDVLSALQDAPYISHLGRDHGKEHAFSMSQWNQFDTAAYSGVIAETITCPGHNGDLIHAYYARPTGPGPFPGIVLAHHAPGWDEFYREMAYRFANHGYAVLMPDLYCRH